MRNIVPAIAALLLAVPATPAIAGPAPDPSAPTPVSVANSQSVRFKSWVNGRDYQLSVAIPLMPPPKDGYPVLYLLDPHFMFGAAVDAVRMNAPDVVVVGIGYPLDDDAFVHDAAQDVIRAYPAIAGLIPARTLAASALRGHDMTLGVTAETWRIGGLPELAEVSARRSGGLDAFLDMIEQEVKPRVAQIAPTNPANTALFGHSLGWLAVLHALFTRPAAYRSFIAASPSIWAAPKLWEEERQFSRTRATPRILLAVGAKEQDRQSAAKMVDNMREMARRLKSSSTKDHPLVVEDVVFEQEDHGSVQLPSLSRAIGFAFGKAG